MSFLEAIVRKEVDSKVDDIVGKISTQLKSFDSCILNELKIITKAEDQIYKKITKAELTNEDKSILLVNYTFWKQRNNELIDVIEKMIYNNSPNDASVFISAGIILGKMQDKTFESDTIGSIQLIDKEQ